MRKRAEWQGAVKDGSFWTAAEAREALAACERSGETVVAFARRHGLTATRLYWWRQRLKKDKRVEGGDARLIPVTIRSAGVEPSRTHGCVCVIDGELRIEVVDASAVPPGWVAALLRLWREGGA